MDEGAQTPTAKDGNGHQQRTDRYYCSIQGVLSKKEAKKEVFKPLESWEVEPFVTEVYGRLDVGDQLYGMSKWTEEWEFKRIEEEPPVTP